jgi:tetratricopeptide (TPR) repeat protein
MLEVDLLEAKARKRRLYLAVASGLLLGGLVLVLVVSLIPETQLGPVSTKLDKPPEIPKVDMEPNVAQPVEPKPSPEPIQSQQIKQEDQSEFKEQFFAAVKTYDEEVRPNIQKYRSMAGDQEFMNVMAKYQQNAAARAAQNQYRDGLEIVQKMTQVGSDRIGIEKKRLEQTLEKVATAWATKDIDIASASLEKARLISPNNTDIMKYSDLLSDWPEVNNHLENAAANEAQGNLDGAIKSLQQIANLNHDINNLVSRIDVLKAKQKNILESHLIEQLFTALDKSDLPLAAEVIQRLRKAGIPESTYTHLITDYEKKKYDADFLAVSKTIDSAIVNDDWVQAKQLIDQNQKVFGGEPRFKARAEAIYKVYGGIQDVSNALVKPNELLSSRVRANVHNLLERIGPDLKMSAQLKTKAGQLSDLLSTYRKKVPVTVISDGSTYIEVKSVGKVGETTGRVIELLPGKYIFIGKKPGYISKQVKLNVEPETPIKIKVIADEPI